MADILLAEDEADIRLGLVATLESEGHSVRAAADGGEAMRMFSGTTSSMASEPSTGTVSPSKGGSSRLFWGR